MMDSMQRRMIGVAVSVCAFAVGMAGLLNYFKYAATAERIVEQRLGFTGRSIENSILTSLSLGLQFADLSTLPAMLERERAADELILGIDVFDSEGRTLYSTDAARRNQAAPQAWLAAAHRVGHRDWVARSSEGSVVGLSLQNDIGLTIGHVALRYDGDRVRRSAHGVAPALAMVSAGVFAVAAVAASLAMLMLVRRIERDVAGVEAAAHRREAGTDPAGGPFTQAARRYGATVSAAEAALVDVRAALHHEGGR